MWRACRFDTIPNSLAHVATILAGDWPTGDFTWGGQIVCMLFVVVGIGLFAIPVGTVFEAFEDVLTAKQEAREARQQVRCAPERGCNCAASHTHSHTLSHMYPTDSTLYPGTPGQSRVQQVGKHGHPGHAKPATSPTALCDALQPIEASALCR